jgi:hypothetical protein
MRPHDIHCESSTGDMYHHTPLFRLAKLLARFDPAFQSPLSSSCRQVDQDSKFGDRVAFVIVSEVQPDRPSIFVEKSVVVKNTCSIHDVTQ